MQNGQLIGGSGGGVKSVQRGVITLAGVTTNTATITAVDPTNSVVHWLGENSTYITDAQTRPGYVGLTLTNGTTVTATRANASNAATVSFEVVEYYPGFIKSIQRGTQVVTGTTTNIAITAVTDLTRTQLIYMGHQGDANTFMADSGETYANLTSTTNIALRCNNAAGTNIYHWQVVEYY